MRTVLQAIYRITLKGIAVVGFLLFFAYGPVLFGGGEMRDLWHPIPIVAIGALIASTLAFAVLQTRLPDAIARPQRPGHIAALVPVMATLAVITPVGAMTLLTSQGHLGDAAVEMMRPIAVSTAALFASAYMFVMFLGILLSLWAPSEKSAAPAARHPHKAPDGDPMSRLQNG